MSPWCLYSYPPLLPLKRLTKPRFKDYVAILKMNYFMFNSPQDIIAIQ